MYETKSDKEEYARKMVEEVNTYKARDGRLYPIDKNNLDFPTVKLGGFVTIRSTREIDEKDLMIGIFVGTIKLLLFGNPIFYVPRLKRCLAGIESWWKPIPKDAYNKTCEQMRDKYGFSWEDVEEFCSRMLKRRKKGRDIEEMSERLVKTDD